MHVYVVVPSPLVPPMPTTAMTKPICCYMVSLPHICCAHSCGTLIRTIMDERQDASNSEIQLLLGTCSNAGLEAKYGLRQVSMQPAASHLHRATHEPYNPPETRRALPSGVGEAAHSSSLYVWKYLWTDLKVTPSLAVWKCLWTDGCQVMYVCMSPIPFFHHETQHGSLTWDVPRWWFHVPSRYLRILKNIVKET